MNNVFSEDGPAELYDGDAEKNSCYCDRCGGYHGSISCPPDPACDELEHDADCDCRHCCPEPVDAEERYIRED